MGNILTIQADSSISRIRSLRKSQSKSCSRHHSLDKEKKKDQSKSIGGKINDSISNTNTNINCNDNKTIDINKTSQQADKQNHKLNSINIKKVKEDPATLLKNDFCFNPNIKREKAERNELNLTNAKTSNLNSSR